MVLSTTQAAVQRLYRNIIYNILNIGMKDCNDWKARSWSGP